jgi:hypothetical protein
VRLAQLAAEGRGLDELGPGADDGDDRHRGKVEAEVETTRSCIHRLRRLHR